MMMLTQTRMHTTPAINRALRCVFALLVVSVLAPALAAAAQEGAERDPVTNRRVNGSEPVYLNFDGVKVTETITFIVETTGKTVIPRQGVENMQVTVISDESMTRDEALNRLFTAFLENGVGVIEGEDIIILAEIQVIGTGDVPVVGWETSLKDRRDDGVIINKVYRVRYANAESIAEVIEAYVPDWSEVQFEADSNSIVVLCNIGLGKKLEEMIANLDARGQIAQETFFLKYADAATIADQIMQLFGPDESGDSGGANRNRNEPRRPEDFIRGRQGGGRDADQGAGGGQGGGGPVVELRVATDTRSNSITVIGSPAVVEAVGRLINEQLDVKTQPTGEQIVKIYSLMFTDVTVVRDILEELTGGSGGASRSANQRAAAARQDVGGGGSGGGTPLTDLYKFQAYPATNRLIAIAKTSASFELLDQVIEELDQPGMNIEPSIIELKHADAQELATELNVAFQKPGIRTAFRGRETGLADFQGQEDPSGQTTGAGQGAPAEAEEVEFPWQLDRATGEAYTPIHELEGRVRIMPIFRRNALLVVGPPHLQEHVKRLISQLDQPGRQVLLTAIIAEVQLEDLLAIGLRWSRSDLFTPRDNQFGGSAAFNGVENDFLNNVFDTTVLDVNVDLAAVIDLLDRDTDVRILSTPRIFTHDNEQANFFDGQTIQVVEGDITDIQTGNLNRTFQDKQVGLTLSARPRITANRDVDLLVNLEISSLSPNTTPQGGLIFDRRVTSTRVLLKDRQTIVISGILREEEADIKRRIPLLGHIPIVGALFTSTDQQSSQSELIAFVTPIVVDNPEEADALNAPYRERLEQMQRPVDEQRKDAHTWDSNYPVPERRDGQPLDDAVMDDGDPGSEEGSDD